MSSTAPYEAAVIGAGMAGLSAARVLAEAGKRTLLLEANERVGGRAWTVNGADGSTPIELGAEFVHGEPEPTLSLAREAGVELLPVEDQHLIKRGGAFQALPDPWQPFERVLKRLEPSAEDVSAQRFVEQQGFDAETKERVRQLIEGFEAAPLDEVSIASLVADSESIASDDKQFRVAGGYGRLVDFLHEKVLSAGVDLRLGSAVTRVGWQLNGPVALSLRDIELRARTCIVTVPLGVLQADPLSARGLSFEPAVDAWRAPLEQLAMGHACRVTFQFRRGFARDAAPRRAFIHQPTSLFETFWSSENADYVQWTAWAGGPKARELAREPRELREKLALGALATLFDLPEATLLQALVGILNHHDFSNDPRSRGAYSFCRPGGARASEALQAPVAGALFLAGEATDHSYPGTVAGALSSGARAAAQALATLARQATSPYGSAGKR